MRLHTSTAAPPSIIIPNILTYVSTLTAHPLFISICHLCRRLTTSAPRPATTASSTTASLITKKARIRRIFLMDTAYWSSE
ncbi:hypothetical protein Tco_1163586 [Tanacetum coccineum]